MVMIYVLAAGNQFTSRLVYCFVKRIRYIPVPLQFIPKYQGRVSMVLLEQERTSGWVGSPPRNARLIS